MAKPFEFFALLTVTMAVAGCASATSTLLMRDESNSVWEKKKHLTGIPITLKVPTHVKVYVYETYYLQTVTVGGVERTERLKLPFNVRDFAQEFIYTEKIFTVDFKRPAAGTFNLRLDMTEDQYFQNVAQDVTDQTIQQVGSLIKTLAPGGLIPTLAGASDGAVPLDALVPVKSVVAVGIFEIDAPDFEQQLTTFINNHITQSHDAWTVAPGVTRIHRVPVNDDRQNSNLTEGIIIP
jgi:hypothetical protein